MTFSAKELGRCCGRAAAADGTFEKEALFRWLTESRPWKAIVRGADTVANTAAGAGSAFLWNTVHGLSGLGANAADLVGSQRAKNWLQRTQQDAADLARAGHMRWSTALLGPETGLRVTNWIGNKTLTPFSPTYAGTTIQRPSAVQADPALLAEVVREARTPADREQLRKYFSSNYTNDVRKAQLKGLGFWERAPIAFSNAPAEFFSVVNPYVFPFTTPSFADLLARLVDWNWSDEEEAQ